MKGNCSNGSFFRLVPFMDDIVCLNMTSMNCSADCDNCSGLTLEFWTAYDGAYYATYYALAPLFFLFGLTGHILCLVAFAKETRKDSAYSYQVFVSLSQACEVIFYILYVLSLKLSSGVERDSVAWFRNRYVLVWYTAHLATPLSNICITTSLILALCMAIDRFCALYYPHTYKNWHHRRNRVIALVVSLSLGVSTSLFAVLRYKIVVSENPARGYYKVVLDIQYASTATASILSHMRNVIRLIAVILLIMCNTVNWKLFRSRVLKVGNDEQTTGSHSGHAVKNKRTKLEAERTLFVLVIVESSLVTFGMTALTAYFFAIFTTPIFAKCDGLLMIPFVDMALNLSNMGKFYIAMAVDARFRRMIWRACFRKGAAGNEMHAPATQGHVLVAPVTAC